MKREALITLINEAAELRLKNATTWRSDGQLLLIKLNQWATDPIMWFTDCVYSPDPQDFFGGKTIPEGMTWAGMVPLIPHPAQCHLIQELDDIIRKSPALYAARGLTDIGQRLDANYWKSRQQALTTIVTGLCLKWWLFEPSFRGLLLSFEKEAVDAGGKDDRTEDSLFGRVRMQLDAFLWLYTPLQFNQHLSKRQRTFKEANTLSGMTGSEDKGFKLTRPPWFLDGHEIFPRASKNTLLGTVPSDTSGKSRSYSVVIFDEFGEYRVGVDKKAYSAVKPCCPHLITIGTIPDGGGLASHFKRLSDDQDNPQLISRFFSWTHNMIYMQDAYATCRGCDQKIPIKPGPGFEYLEIRVLDCALCGKQTSITHRDVRSKWFNSQTRGEDEVNVERYYWGGWVGAQVNLAFHGFNATKALVARGATTAWQTHIGYDPGRSEQNPAVVLVMRVNPTSMRLRYIAHIQVAGWATQKLVPFFKCWRPSQLQREKIIYGSPAEIGQTFDQRFTYTRLERDIMERLSEFTHGPKFYQGDKYGSHNNAGAGTAFGILNHYGVRPKYRYEMERDHWIQKLQDVWVPALEVEDTFASTHPSGGKYPTFLEVIQTAQMVTGEGHGEVKYDISGKLPSPYVKDVIDALLYLSRGLPNMARAMSDEAGNFSVQAPQKGEIITYAEEPHFG